MPLGHNMTAKSDARRALASVMISVGRAGDPLAVFKAREGSIRSALHVLGRDFNPRKFLRSCGLAARAKLVSDSDDQPKLPAAAVKAFAAVVSELGHDTGDVVIVDVVGGRDHGFSFTYRAGDQTRSAFAIEHYGRWVCAPGPLDRQDLDSVTYAFRRHFDLLIAMILSARGFNEDDIAEARRAVLPTRALWPDERDPRGLSDDTALVFRFHNPTPLKRAFYCGFDPITDSCVPYDFG